MSDDKAASSASNDAASNGGGRESEGAVQSWVLVGDFWSLSRRKCQRLYARSGKSDDLTLVCAKNKMFALESWCSHMGKSTC